MHEIEKLQIGDGLYVQTTDGWYTYGFRDLEYVMPKSVDGAQAGAAPAGADARTTVSSR